VSDDQNTNAPDGETPTVMTELVSPTEQIGRNVMTALGDADAVAVLTTLVPGVGSDRVVSVGLTAQQMHEVGVLLNEIETEDEEAANDEQRCIGFQCRIEKD
jgi:hypothetical protein